MRYDYELTIPYDVLFRYAELEAEILTAYRYLCKNRAPRAGTEPLRIEFTLELSLILDDFDPNLYDEEWMKCEMSQLLTEYREQSDPKTPHCVKSIALAAYVDFHLRVPFLDPHDGHQSSATVRARVL